MKKLLLLVVGLMSSAAFGQDYYAPVDKDKEPLARFPINLKFDGNTMSYTLPIELTGSNSNVIQLKKDAEINGISTYVGEKATATCMTREDEKHPGQLLPGCVVKHQNLVLNKERADIAVDNKFMDPGLRDAAKAINKKFILESGNEPIGFIGALNAPNAATKWEEKAIGATQWLTTFQYDRGGFKDVLVDFGNKATYFLQQDGTWHKLAVLSEVRWTDHHVSGIWEMPGLKGWYDFTFNNELNKFEGYFAEIKDASKIPSRQGRWNGTKSTQVINVPK